MRGRWIRETPRTGQPGSRTRRRFHVPRLPETLARSGVDRGFLPEPAAIGPREAAGR
jgi:hypothetical protein